MVWDLNVISTNETIDYLASTPSYKMAAAIENVVSLKVKLIIVASYLNVHFVLVITHLS